ncbi:hypothetical protein LQ938_11545 [Microbacterium sp. cx-55]|uniref:hypothetical protein n=1 Tax=Microbacterium sp. cx-55 TaxID=2875948 RepID=UPI001CC0E3AA|nr:hypothetical protein [Microbacterium sp. cx-55]MBZ4488091.1 hypothetical protein [Microbacterium sp. cx-55]UGB34500.1 hypothetical protein LQ938_11545 [Microbacterium sp. cx-55]
MPSKPIDNDAEQRFQLAAGASRRIVRQSRTHAERVTARLSDWINAVPATISTPCGRDKVQALAGDHLSSFGQRLEHLEAQCNAIVSHLSGVQTLLFSDPFQMLPSVPIARAVAEISASCAWELDSRVDSDERAARSYAMAFRSIETVIAQLDGSEAEQLEQLRERLVERLRSQGYGVVRKDRDGVTTNEVVQVKVGRRYAKIGFQYSQRIAAEIPALGSLYASMSGLTHGEPSYLATNWGTPDAVARLLGVVTLRSVEAWSVAIHRWIGASNPPFTNRGHYEDLMRSVPEAHRI